MKKIYILFCAITLSLNTIAQTFEWVKQYSGGTGSKTFADSFGNIYTTGYYQNTINFENSTLPNTAYTSVFLSKTNQNGDIIWAKSFGGNLFCAGNSLKLDANGNIYVVGYFGGSGDFDPGPNSFILSANPNNATPQPDIFISKFDNDGNFLWAKGIGEKYYDWAADLIFDENNNPIIIGSYGGTVDFDPGIGTAFKSSLTTDRDIFILKLNTQGDYIWAKSFGGESEDFANSITTDPSGNIYANGTFRNWADFDGLQGSTGYLLTNGNGDGFVCKMDNFGNFIWVRNIGGSSFDEGNSVKCDSNGNVFILGYFNQNCDLNPSANEDLIVNSAGNSDIYLVALNPSGTFLWGKTMGSTGYDYGTSLEIKGNSLYFLLNFNGTLNFGTNMNISNLTSTGMTDICLGKMTTDGNYLWAKKIGGSADDYAYSINVDVNNNIVLTGFQNDINFYNGAKKEANGSGLLLEKFSQIINPLPINLVYFNGVPSKKGNLLMWQTSSEFENDYFTLEKSNSDRKWEPIFTQTGQAKSIESINYQYLDENIDNSLTYYRLKQTDISGKVTYSKIILVNNMNHNEQVNIYPNPANYEINIISNVTISDLYIINSVGKTILSEKFSKKNFKIYLDNINEGNYLIQYKTEKGNYSKKIVVSK